MRFAGTNGANDGQWQATAIFGVEHNHVVAHKLFLAFSCLFFAGVSCVFLTRHFHVFGMNGKITGNVSIMMVGPIRSGTSFGLCAANGESVEVICQLCEPKAWVVGLREARDDVWYALHL